MKKLLVILSVLLMIFIVALESFEGAVAVMVVTVMSVAVVFLIKQKTEQSEFLIQVFLAALIVRIIFGMFIHIFELRPFFGGDALTYDSLGNRLVDIWFNNFSPNDPWSQKALSTSLPGWGMHYLTGIIYSITGRNILAAQFFCAVFGAATVPLVYLCAKKIFHNQKVGTISALLIAFFPAFIIWSSQLLKDGLIVFLLVLAMTLVLQLQEKLNYASVGLLIFSLFGILSLRFYIFYMVALAVAGSFVVGLKNTTKSVVTRLVVLIMIGISLTYLGVMRYASSDVEEYASLERIQRSRAGLANAESGFGDDVDVSTTEGAITAIPVGLLYLMLAPFPWQMTNFRQMITAPETILWWILLPFMFTGIWYTIRYRFRKAIAVLIFTVMLTLAYSIFQGNVGTAYRQRTQIQVFLFMFIAVGLTLRNERRENQRIMDKERKKRLEMNLRKR